MPLEYDESDKFCQRLAYVCEVEKIWWKQWIKEVLPTLLPARKWKQRSNNLGIGEVVMLTYPGNIRNDYILVRVTEIFSDTIGLVRNVRVKYTNKNWKKKSNKCQSKIIEEIVAVQKLVLLEPY